LPARCSTLQYMSFLWLGQPFNLQPHCIATSWHVVFHGICRSCSQSDWFIFTDYYCNCCVEDYTPILTAPPLPPIVHLPNIILGSFFDKLAFVYCTSLPPIRAGGGGIFLMRCEEFWSAINKSWHHKSGSLLRNSAQWSARAAS
jgi:hypothetical protein